jgi:hypothetical protein
MMRSSPPRPGHCEEVAGQGGATRSSLEWRVNDEGNGGDFDGGVPVMGSSSGGDVLEHREANRG